MKRRRAVAFCAAVALAALAATAARAHTVQSSVSPGGGGSIAPAGAVAVQDGADAAFTIVPSNGFHIADVRVNGTSVGPVPRYVFAGVCSNQTIEASFHVPWAVRVAAYTRGANAATPGHHFAATALGEPSRRTSDDFGIDTVDVTVFQPPWMTNQVVSVGAGGELVLEFDHPVLDDPKNPYGIDLLVFGNTAFSVNAAGKVFGLIGADAGRVSVSQNGTNWTEVTGAKADYTFPTQGFRNTSGPTDRADGTLPTDFVLPVNPMVTWMNKTYTQLVAEYGASGGGSGVDIASTGLPWIRYVKVWQAAGMSVYPEVDALSDVAPSLLRTLAIRSAFQRCSPPEGNPVYTSGVPVACSVTVPVLPLGVGTQIACVGWVGAGSVPPSGTGTAARFTIGVDSALTWQWQTQVQLRVAAETGGTTSVTGGWYRVGSKAEVAALPDAGYCFSGWSGDVPGATGATPVCVTLDRARVLTARFASQPTVRPEVQDWLRAHGLTNASPWEAAQADVDRDGLTAMEEYLAGTDPTNAASVFRFLAVDVAHGSNRLEWLGGTGGSTRPFCVLGRGSLTGAWTVLAAAVGRAPDGTNVWWHASPAGPVFYRVRVRDE